MNSVHLQGSEDVARAGHNMQQAADTISRAASTIDSANERLGRNLEQHGYQMGALAEEQATAPVLRDQLAIAAMQGLLARPFTKDERGRPFVEWVSQFSFEMADAMLKAREA